MPNNEATEQSILNSINNSGGIPVMTFSIEVSGMTAYPTDKTLSISGMAADAKETGDAIDAVQAAVADLNTDVQGIKAWTGADIKVNTDQSSPTIAQAFANIASIAYPVGSIFMTTDENGPDFPGTWVEIAITASWSMILQEKRGYRELEEGETGGDVHFWLRTE